MPRAKRVRVRRKSTPAFWQDLQQLLQPVHRGMSFTEPDIERVKREAIEGRELMKETDSGR